MKTDKLLEVKGLKQYFKLDKQTVIKAVDDISFDMYKGEIVSLVGESGCGKSTMGRSIVGMYEPTEGEIIYKGKCISDKKIYRKIKKEICKSMQIIFQDPAAALNSRMTIGGIIAEPLKIQAVCKNRAERIAKVEELLELVGLDKSYRERYPSDFSGGQKQRVAIARALALGPELIIADEPIASLDVSIQAQIVNLFKKLQKEKGLACLFISHDLAMAGHISDRIGVMYRGKLVELGTPQTILESPVHPYTKSLISSILVTDPSCNHRHHRYEPDRHDYTVESPSWVEIEAGHFVYASPSEVQ
ncbi:MAG: ATP-binding cassette domain-containing protein [Cellulosilyticaceae bacterium]